MEKNKQYYSKVKTSNFISKKNIETIIICWNNEFPIKVATCQNLVEIIDERPVQYLVIENNDVTTLAYNREELDEFLKLNRNNYLVLKVAHSENELINFLKEEEKLLGFLILCELSWCLGHVDQTLSSMSGIELSKQLRVKQSKEPILFVSFLTRKQILTINSEQFKIISVTCSEFFQLSRDIPIQIWIKLIKGSKKLSEVGLIDVNMHYIKPQNMLAELKHDISKKRNSPPIDSTLFFEQTKEKIALIYSKPLPTKIISLFDLPHETNEEFNMKLGKICTELDDLKLETDSDNYGSSQDGYDQKPKCKFKCLILDDEKDSDPRFNNLFKSLEIAGFEIVQDKNSNIGFKDSDIALQAVEEDIKNDIDVIISDYRLWKNEENILIHQTIQGYDFVTECVKFGRTYSYVVLSALDRNFLMEPIGVHKVRYKNGVLANEESIADFVNDMKELAKTKRNKMASKIHKNPWFGKIYNWSRDCDDKVDIEKDIAKLADNAIEILIKCDQLKKCKTFKNCTQCPLIDIQPSSHNFTSLGTEFGKAPNRTNWDSMNTEHQVIAKQKLAMRRVWLFCYQFLNKVGCAHCPSQAMQFIYSKNKHFASSFGSLDVNLPNPNKILWINQNNPKQTEEESDWLKKHFKSME